MMMLAALVASAEQDTLKVECVRVVGPFATGKVMLTTKGGSNGKPQKAEDLPWDTYLDLDLWKTSSQAVTLPDSPADSSHIILREKGIYELGFTLDNTRHRKFRFDVQAKGTHLMYVDGRDQGGDVTLDAGRHDCVVKLEKDSTDNDTVTITVNAIYPDSLRDDIVRINQGDKSWFYLQDQMSAEHLSKTEISADGRFVLQHSYITRADGRTDWTKTIYDTRTGNRYTPEGYVQWAARGGRYISMHRDIMGNSVYEYRDVLTGKATPLYTYTGRNHVSFTAMDTKLLVNERNDGPRSRDNDVHQIMEPDDRQAGWRDRSTLSVLDVRTGAAQMLTSGTRNTGGEISDDGRKALISTYFDDFTERPFNFSSCYMMDLETGLVDTLYEKDGFVAGAQLSPNGTQIAFIGSGEAFGGIGNVCPEGMIPNSYEHGLFLMDVKTHRIVSLTRGFNPSVTNMQWCRADGQLYIFCEDGYNTALFRMNPGKVDFTNGKAQYQWQRIKTLDTYVHQGWDIASEKAVVSYCAEGGMTGDRSWALDMQSGKQTLVADLNAKVQKDYQLGDIKPWAFKTERGDSITGFYCLPPYFDDTKQYPMLVYYYGGCSPTPLYLSCAYSPEVWASMGYVVLILEPSGCSGFGQEFAARHSNAYGDWTADDIIQGTKQFCQEHGFVNAKKVGCLGASYGGFMTQYLQTKTDIFSAAVSHAGISNPTSYWGEGYWGFSYSACSAPNSYPWNNAQLYTEHAPLFNADKIHTPLLFMHGTADTNVPIGESIQMFNALKILGRPTAFIEVEGENHYIGDFHKRIKWHNSIMAWFQKYLQGDDSWWNELYPEK